MSRRSIIPLASGLLLLSLWCDLAAAQAPASTTWSAEAAPEECQCLVEPWFDNFSVFGGIEASRQPQDLGVNANFGGNVSMNLGVPLIDDLGLGFQIGTGVNVSHAGVRVLRVIEETTHREQWFSTAGLFQRGAGWHWAAGFDIQMTSYYNAFTAAQLRGEAGYQLTACDEVGVWGAFGAWGYEGRVLATDFKLDPITQAAFYWRRTWESQAQTRVWLGMAEPHGQDIIILPDRDNTTMVLTFGLEIFAPLNDYVALFGQGNFITPSDTGTLDAYLGVALYPGGGARRAATNRYAPVLAVANNPTFALDFARR